MQVIDGARFLVQAQRDQQLPCLASIDTSHPELSVIDRSFGDDLETVIELPAAALADNYSC